MRSLRRWLTALVLGVLVAASLAGCGRVDRYTIRVNMSGDPLENPSPERLEVGNSAGAQSSRAFYGRTVLVRWQNERTDEVRIRFPTWPFEGQPQEIVVPPGTASPFFTLVRGGRGRTFDYYSPSFPDRPPGEPSIVDGP